MRSALAANMRALSLFSACTFRRGGESSRRVRRTRAQSRDVSRRASRELYDAVVGSSAPVVARVGLGAPLALVSLASSLDRPIRRNTAPDITATYSGKSPHTLVTALGGTCSEYPAARAATAVRRSRVRRARLHRHRRPQREKLGPVQKRLPHRRLVLVVHRVSRSLPSLRSSRRAVSVVASSSSALRARTLHPRSRSPSPARRLHRRIADVVGVSTVARALPRPHPTSSPSTSPSADERIERGRAPIARASPSTSTRARTPAPARTRAVSIVPTASLSRARRSFDATTSAGQIRRMTAIATRANVEGDASAENERAGGAAMTAPRAFRARVVGSDGIAGVETEVEVSARGVRVDQIVRRARDGDDGGGEERRAMLRKFPSSSVVARARERTRARRW